jgi:hypothetical protein
VIKEQGRIVIVNGDARGGQPGANVKEHRRRNQEAIAGVSYQQWD